MKDKLIILAVFLLFAGLAGVMFWRYRVNVIYQETATENLFRPYFNDVLKGDLTNAYDNYTNDYYKSNFALDDYLAAHEKTSAENGKFVGYEINGFRECGNMFAVRALVCSSVILKFESGRTQIIKYQIEQGEGDKFQIKFSGKQTGSNNSVSGFPF